MVARLTLLALLLLLPLALGDHVYSHRVVVTGRVIDAEGRPVPAQDVTVTFEGLEAGDACFDARPERTGPQGDFTVCRHAHALPRNAIVNVTAAGASARAMLDPGLRRVAVYLRLDEPAPARDLEGERIFAKTFHVEGRVVRIVDGETEVEGVRVPTVALGGERVHVEVTHEGRALADANVTTNENGDYAIDLALEDVPAGARVGITLDGGAQRRAPASAEFRRADLDLVLAGEETELPPGRPGTSTPRIPLGAALTPLALAAAALIAARARRA